MLNALIFKAYASLCFLSQKSNYVKLNLSKMKELHQIVLQEGLFASIKGHLCLTKGHLGNPEAQVEVELP